MNHVPVLLPETLRLLDPQPGDTVIDATVGAGGHAAALLERIGPTGRLLGLDRDPAAPFLAARTLQRFAPQTTLVHASFENLQAAANEQGIDRAACILFDLGLSSMLLAEPDRGFSFQNDGPLDMRFDPCHDRQTAADLLNSATFKKLRSILITYGEEPHATAIARAIVAARQKQKLSTTHHLFLAVRDAVRTHRGRIDPATRTFQAIRIAVNRELDVLSAALPQALALLAPGGRLAVISFHSLEDRIVKQFFKRETRGCLCPPEFPVCICGHAATVSILTPKPVTPSPDERLNNPRSRSAKLRSILKRQNV